MNKTIEFKVITKIFENNQVEYFPMKETRFVIVDSDDRLLDDAQGYGYKTVQKAEKAGWFKFKGGREHIKNVQAWWRRNSSFAEKLNEILSYDLDLNNFKAASLKIAKEMGIQGFEVKFLKHLPH